jgi:hypothetical protein
MTLVPAGKTDPEAGMQVTVAPGVASGAG